MGKTADIIIRKQLQEALDKHGLELADNVTVEEILEYLDSVNDDLGETDFENLYTPEMWTEDTIKNYPEYFKPNKSTMEQYCEDAMFYLIRQRDACIDETGETPGLEDYQGQLECEAFKLYMEENADLHYGKITLADIMDYLITYWDRH